MTIRLEQESGRAPAAIAAVVAQVEREPEMIPFVRRVEVCRRGEGWTHYRVTLPLGARVRYAKAVSPSAAAWVSDGGSFGVRQRGEMLLAERPGGGTWIRLTVWTEFAVPGLSALVAPFAVYAFRAWLRALAR